MDLARTRPAVFVGALWLSFIAVAGITLTVKDARSESATVRGAGGALTETPAEAAAYQAVVRTIERNSAADEPIFVAPFMTSLYAITDRLNPLKQLAVIPGAFPTVDDEREAITALRAANVRLAVTDDREKPEYGQTSFGGSYDRVLSQWVSQSFRPIATFRVPAHTTVEGLQQPRKIIVWLRRSR